MDMEGQLYSVDYTVFHKVFEHPQTLVFAETPGTSTPWIQRDRLTEPAETVEGKGQDPASEDFEKETPVSSPLPLSAYKCLLSEGCCSTRYLGQYPGHFIRFLPLLDADG